MQGMSSAHASASEQTWRLRASVPPFAALGTAMRPPDVASHAPHIPCSYLGQSSYLKTVVTSAP